MLTETAWALAGRPQGAPVRVTARFALSARGATLRESYWRQGVTPINGRGLVMSPRVVSPWEAFGGDQVAGADQLGITSLP